MGVRPPGPLYACPPWGGGHPWGALLILHLFAFPFLSQSYILYCIACTYPIYKIKKRNQLYSDSQQYTSKRCLISIAYSIHVYHFENWLFLFVVSLQKWLARFLLQKRWINEGFNGTSGMPLYGGSLEITHVFHWSIITSYKKILLKSHFCPELKKFH